jgi:subtilisin-like proprotein convertase family protein/Ca2+-binding EF-hand superfamily protein
MQSMRSPISIRSPFACATLLLGNLFFSLQLYAQAGLRESLERLDRNENGKIDPDEVTPLARPYLERITRSRSRSSGMSLDRSIEIDKLQEAARIYYSVNNGANGRDVDPEGESTVRPFGPDPEQPMVPEFGLTEIKYPYWQEDLEEADQTLRRYDRNDDGKIDRPEAERARWTHRDPFDDDLDKDDRLSRMELVQRYARRRLLSGASDELIQQARRTGSGVRPWSRDEERRGESEWWRQAGNSHWLTASVLSRFDANKNGRLEVQEAQSLGIPSGQIDVDRDGQLSRSELHALLDEMQRAVGDSSNALPGWFYELDENRDGQVAMSEFSTDWTADKVTEFDLLDSNGDGLLTALEVAGSKAMVAGSYRNTNAEVLPPSKTIISEINVDDEFLIGDLDVQLSITHSNVGFLDAYLTGPDGQRIELFTEVGGGGDHFDQTVFDDQAREPITKAKPPFEGRYLPEGLLKRQPSLGHFNGKNAKGVWQLVVRGTRSDRFGMLHSWGLITRPQEAMTGTSAVARQDVPQAPAARTDNSPQEWRGEDTGSDNREDRDRDEKQIQAEARAKAIAKYKEWLENKKKASLESIKQKRSNGEKGEKLLREKLSGEKSKGEKKFSDQR